MKIVFFFFMAFPIFGMNPSAFEEDASETPNNGLLPDIIISPEIVSQNASIHLRNTNRMMKRSQPEESSQEDKQDPKRTKTSEFCSTHKITYLSGNDSTIKIKTKDGEIIEYFKKADLVKLLPDEKTKNRLKNNYAKGKKFESLVLNFTVGENCYCVEKLKEEKMFGNGHTSFIEITGLERGLRDYIPAKDNPVDYKQEINAVPKEPEVTASEKFKEPFPVLKKPLQDPVREKMSISSLLN